jgi:hypothetical protein
MPRTIDDVATVQQGLSTFGRGAGARPGGWMLNVVESRDIGDQCRLDLSDLREVGVVQSPRIERHLLRPYDVLVTARAASVQSALVPPEVSRTVAGSTVLVIRPNNSEWGMGHYLWYFLTSAYGQREIAKRLSTAATITSLSAANLGEIQLQVPSMQELDQVARIVEASEEAYALEMEAARLRRETVRDAIISIMGAMPAPANEEESCRSLAKN